MCPAEENATPRNRPPARLLLTLAAGLGAGFVLAMLLFGRIQADLARLYLVVAGTYLLLGRVAGTSLGLSADLDASVLLALNTFSQLVLLLVFLPAFARLCRTGSAWWPWLGRQLRTIREQAAAHRGRVDRYGPVGIFGFVAFPLYLTGPLMGMALGYLIGLRTWTNYLAVLAGNLAATLCWLLMLQQLNTWTGILESPLLVVLLLAGVVATVALVRILGRD